MDPWKIVWNSETQTYTATISVELAVEAHSAQAGARGLGLKLRELSKDVLERAELFPPSTF